MANDKSEKKRLSCRQAFVKWAMETPGVFNWSQEVLLREMGDIDTHIGMAWLAWRSAWRTKS